MIRVILPAHLKNLAKVSGEVEVEVGAGAGLDAGVGAGAGAGEPVTQRLVLDALEARYPMLRGTIRDHRTGLRRPFIRFYACEEDISNEPPDAPLPDKVVAGEEPLLVVGAMAGG